MTESYTEKIVNKIAEREGVGPLELTPPLYDVIDLDAVESLATDPSGDAQDKIRIQFSYCGYGIIIEGEDVCVTDE